MRTDTPPGAFVRADSLGIRPVNPFQQQTVRYPMMGSAYKERSSGGHSFVDEGPADSRTTVVLLHGMIGGPGNWDDTITALVSRGNRVIAPVLPVCSLPKGWSGVSGLAAYVERFMTDVSIKDAVVVGNSLGGHVALMLALRHPERVRALVLLGSSGIHEVDMGENIMRRNDREYLRERIALTFFDPVHVTDELIDQVMEIINDRVIALQLIRMARAARKEVVLDELSEISAPTLIVWGRQDAVTPPHVAETFGRLIPKSEVHWIDRCGHAPMMEHPETFNRTLIRFIERLDVVSAVA